MSLVSIYVDQNKCHETFPLHLETVINTEELYDTNMQRRQVHEIFHKNGCFYFKLAQLHLSWKTYRLNLHRYGNHSFQ